MRHTSVWAAVVIVAALLEATWLPLISIQHVTPDLLLVMVVYFAITEGAERGMYTGLLGGIFQDASTNTTVGHHVLCLVVVGFVVGNMANRLITDNPYVKTVTVLVASIAHGILYVLIEYVQTVDAEAVYTMSLSIMPQAFYTAVVTPIVFYLIELVRPQAIHGRGYNT